MTTITVYKPIKCKHCPTTTTTSVDVARVLGWRFFQGQSVTGKPLDDDVCPACAGTAAPPEAPKPSWRVGCHTCDWVWEDEYNEGPLDPEQAKRMADDHECEPEVWVGPPTGDERYAPWQVNKDGSIKESTR